MHSVEHLACSLNTIKFWVEIVKGGLGVRVEGDEINGIFVVGELERGTTGKNPLMTTMVVVVESN
jgi:hypothetical protein